MTLFELLASADKYDIIVEDEVRSFYSLQFSKSSMSVYVTVIKDDKIFNKMIITGSAEELQFHGLVLKDKETGNVIELKEISFNDDGNMYKSTDYKLVQQAMDQFNIMQSIKNARSLLYPSTTKCSWVGGETDYSVKSKVYAKCMERPLSKKGAADLLTRINEKRFESFTHMQLMTLKELQAHPEYLSKECSILKETYQAAAFLYAYRISCINVGDDSIFPVMISDEFWVVKEAEVGSVSTVF